MVLLGIIYRDGDVSTFRWNATLDGKAGVWAANWLHWLQFGEMDAGDGANDEQKDGRA